MNLDRRVGGLKCHLRGSFFCQRRFFEIGQALDPRTRLLRASATCKFADPPTDRPASIESPDARRDGGRRSPDCAHARWMPPDIGCRFPDNGRRCSIAHWRSSRRLHIRSRAIARWGFCTAAASSRATVASVMRSTSSSMATPGVSRSITNNPKRCVPCSRAGNKNRSACGSTISIAESRKIQPVGSWRYRVCRPSNSPVLCASSNARDSGLSPRRGLRRIGFRT